MVSFSCEECGDVLTKKKLDAHRGHCRAPAFTCLDCMSTFRGSEHKAHTSCITEAEKYEGPLHKEKGPKHHRKPTMADNVTAGRTAFVEDVPDPDAGRLVTVETLPQAPSPPSALPTPAGPVNVFDFLVNDQTPEASKISLPLPDETRMIEDTPLPPVYQEIVPPETSKVDVNMTATHGYDLHYIENGYSYGTEPVEPSLSRYDSFVNIAEARSLHRADPYSVRFQPPEHRTPAARLERPRDRARPDEKDGGGKSKSDRKRKRHHVEDLDLSLHRRPSDSPLPEADAVMTDAPPLLHSGLTGGLTRLLARPDFPPSPDYSGGDGAGASPLSPLKRSKPSRTDKAERERARERRKERSKREASRKTSDESRHLPAGLAGLIGLEHERPSRDGSRTGGHRERRRDRDRDRERERHRDRERDRDGLTREQRREARHRRRRSSSPKSRTHKVLKAIEFPQAGSPSSQTQPDHQGPAGGQLILREEGSRALQQVPGHRAAGGNEDASKRAQLFLSFVNKGPDSSRGCSINKALKRWHREQGERASGGSGGSRKAEDEKELWRALRLKKNDRGEVVVFF